jgi:peptide/nickel transport system permease protein
LTTVSEPASPQSIAAIAELPELLPLVKFRRGLFGFVRRQPAIAIGGILVLAMLLIAIFAPYLGTIDPTALAPARRLREPSATFWFGTDMLGRDIYSRVLYGARVSLTVGFAVAILSSLTGLAVGLVSGFLRWADGTIMRVMDGLMSIPPILLAVALMALTRGSVGNVITATPSRKSRACRAWCAAWCFRSASSRSWMRRSPSARARRRSFCATFCRIQSPR